MRLVHKLLVLIIQLTVIRQLHEAIIFKPSQLNPLITTLIVITIIINSNE